MSRRRLDLELVRRGLVSTSEEAREVIAGGRVTVGGRPAAKAETLVSAAEAVAVRTAPRTYVSRGGDKLVGALDRFAVDVEGRDCLDAGASSGGFTDVLLARGAARVVAVDVGYGQLAWRLRTDERVIVMERTNVRELRQEQLPFRPEIVTADLSFISLEKLIPTLVEIASSSADLIVLVKPQFEARRDEVASGGVVTDPAVWERVLRSVIGSFASSGAPAQAVAVSPLPGPAGNVEFFLHASAGAEAPALDLEGSLRHAEAIRSVEGRAS